MDSQNFKPLIFRNIIPLALGGLGLLLVIIGLFQVFSNRTTEPAITLEEADKENNQEEIVVDIGGAVIKPGVYKLSSDSRTVDALA